MGINTYRVTVDAKITGYVRCHEDDFTDAVHDMLEGGTFDQVTLGSIDWEHADRSDLM